MIHLNSSVDNITIVRAGVLFRDPALWYEGFSNQEIREMSLHFGSSSTFSFASDIGIQSYYRNVGSICDADFTGHSAISY
jgi:hypothetical protein